MRRQRRQQMQLSRRQSPGDDAVAHHVGEERIDSIPSGSSASIGSPASDTTPTPTMISAVDLAP